MTQDNASCYRPRLGSMDGCQLIMPLKLPLEINGLKGLVSELI